MEDVTDKEEEQKRMEQKMAEEILKKKLFIS